MSTPPPRDADSLMVPHRAIDEGSDASAAVDEYVNDEAALATPPAPDAHERVDAQHIGNLVEFARNAPRTYRDIPEPPPSWPAEDAPDALRLAREAVAAMDAARADLRAMRDYTPAESLQATNRCLDAKHAAADACIAYVRALPSGAAVQGEAVSIGYVKPKSLEWLRQNPQGCIQLFGLPIKDNGDCPVYATPLAKSEGTDA